MSNTIMFGRFKYVLLGLWMSSRIMQGRFKQVLMGLCADGWKPIGCIAWGIEARGSVSYQDVAA